jgi:hypothetical protein
MEYRTHGSRFNRQGLSEIPINVRAGSREVYVDPTINVVFAASKMQC